MSVNITLPLWLSIIIGIIISLNLFINVVKLIPKNIWIKILIFLFYKNNVELYKLKKQMKKANDSLNSELYMKKKQKKKMDKKIKAFKNKNSNGSLSKLN